MTAKEKKTQADRHTEIEDSLELQAEESASLENELRSTIDRLQRLQAEFENYKKRALREGAASEQRITDSTIIDFLPLYDNLQRAFQSLSSNHDVETFVAGVEQIFAQFQQVLEAKGVEPIETKNQPFNPVLHEAMLSVPNNVEKNMIIEEFMPGYLRNERVLRASKVSVSQGAPLSEEAIE